MINELWGTRDKKIKQGLRIFFQGKCLNLVHFFLIFYITGDIFFSLSQKGDQESEGREKSKYSHHLFTHQFNNLLSRVQFALLPRARHILPVFTFFFSFLFQLLLSLFFLLSKFIKFVHVIFTVKKCSARRKKISSLNFLFFFHPPIF